MASALDDLLGGRSRRAIGRACGIRRDTLRAWEMGRARPRNDTVIRLAAALGRDPVDVMREVELLYQRARAQLDVGKP
jgi:transcriptional regulator with XRE-family HTH domain